MSNENEVYIIEDIHPKDAHHSDKNELVGTKFVGKITEISPLNPYFVVANGTDFDGYWRYFIAVKVRKVENKSFWQKLFTWSW